MMTIRSILGAVIALASVTFSVETTYVDNKPSTPTINSVHEFINFAKSVNSGTSYSGTTVYLNSDIDFNEEPSKQFESIGKDYSNYFNGTFDGQGHVISNLRINSAYWSVGLFGYSNGLTIKNIILDDSCSITSSYSSIFYAYVGGIIGKCRPKNGDCIIENSINMASVTFSGNAKSGDLNLGGIAGEILSYSSKYSTIVKNCANYGSITHSGKSEQSFIGGIVAGSSWGGSGYKYIQNCVNYGTITHSGTSKELYIGGITGYSYYTYVENCLSAGKISVSEPFGSKIMHLFSSYQKYIGSIVGSATSKTNIKHCFWTSDVGFNKIYGQGSPKDIVGVPESPVDVFGAVNELNAQVLSNNGNNWNKWLYNPNRRKVKFTINDNEYFSLVSQVILLPDLVSSNVFKFNGWYTDPGCSIPFINDEVATDKELHGVYNKEITVTFESNDISAPYESFRKVILGGAYGELPKPTRKGYTFDGWFTDEDEIITDKTIVKTDNDHTLYAHWRASDASDKHNLILTILFYIVICAIISSTVIFGFKKILTSRRGKNVMPSGAYSRIVSLDKNEIATRYPNGRGRSILSNLYPHGYQRPTMRGALSSAQLPDDKIDKIIEACENCSRTAADEGKLFEGFTEEDAAVIAMYTYDFSEDDYESNPFRIINKSLAERDYAGLQRSRGILYLVMTTLRKLPRTPKKTLYRGVKAKMNLDEDHYYVGNTIAWVALSPTSSDMKQTEEFLTRGSKNGKATGTLFIIENGWGYDIQPYSLYPDEAEILIEPERQFEVTGVIESDELTTISLKMLDTQLSIPEIFGEERK